MNLSAKLGYKFKNAKLLNIALTHKSAAINKALCNNERFEFLGDRVLDLAITELLINKFPNESEGKLTKLKASLVNKKALASLAVDLQLIEYLKLGSGEDKVNIVQNERIMSSTLEAIIGAIYLDSNYSITKFIIIKIFDTLIAKLDSDLGFPMDYKTVLQEITQKKTGAVPQYKIISCIGPEHDRTFSAEAILQGTVIGYGIGKTKKEAEQNAAHSAIPKRD